MAHCYVPAIYRPPTEQFIYLLLFNNEVYAQYIVQLNSACMFKLNSLIYITIHIE